MASCFIKNVLGIPTNLCNSGYFKNLQKAFPERVTFLEGGVSLQGPLSFEILGMNITSSRVSSLISGLLGFMVYCTVSKTLHGGRQLVYHFLTNDVPAESSLTTWSIEAVSVAAGAAFAWFAWLNRFPELKINFFDLPKISAQGTPPQ